MPRISVLIPTHEHALTLPYAVASVQNQGVDDIEILICGDGVGAELRTVAAGLQSVDPRIRFFDLPKAPRLGELNRDHVLRQARGEIVCYQSDDDLWLSGHIAAMQQALDGADFVGAMQVNVDTDDKVRGHYFDLERPEFVKPWLAWTPNDFGTWACNGFGLAFAAHRLEAYRRLPEGWSTAPPGLPTDQTMWHKFMCQTWCRSRFLRWPIALHFPAPDRRDWSPERRAAELGRWSAITAGPDGMARICRDLLPDLGDRLLLQSLQAQARHRDVDAELARVNGTLADLGDRLLRLDREGQQIRQELESERDRLAADLDHERCLRADAERERNEARRRRFEAERGHAEAERLLNGLLSSKLWRMTAPLRAAADWFERFKFRRDA